MKLLIESANNILHGVDLTEEKVLKVSVPVDDPKSKDLLSMAKALNVKISKSNRAGDVTFTGKKGVVRALMADIGLEDDFIHNNYPELGDE